jgi:hypothetical protein
MPDQQWILGEDIHPNDNIFDPITFEQIILALHCNEKEINHKAVMKVAREILNSRLQDFHFLLGRNEEEIIAEAMKGRV